LEFRGGNGVSEGSSTDQQQEEQILEEAESKREIERVICKSSVISLTETMTEEIAFKWNMSYNR